MTRFPFPRWIAVALAFPVAGYIGWKAAGPVDSTGSALVGGALTGAGLAAVQWWASAGRLGRAVPSIAAGATGYAVGLAAGAALVGYDTSLGALVLMGLVSGASLGIAQGLVLTRDGDTRLAAAWSVAMPALFALGWVPTTVVGVSVEEQFTVFGAAGAVLFMLASGLVLATASRPIAGDEGDTNTLHGDLDEGEAIWAVELLRRNSRTSRERQAFTSRAARARR